MRRPSLSLPALLLLPLVLFSCQWDDDFSRLQQPEWHPSLAAPIVNTHISLGDLLEAWGESTWVETDEAGQISLVYEEPLLDASWSSLLALPDRTIPMADTLVEFPVVMPGISLVQLKQGTLTYNISSGLSEAVEVMILIERVGAEEDVFERYVVLQDGGPHQGSFSLAGQEIRAEGGNIVFRYRARRQATGEIVRLQACEYGLQDLAYVYAEGYFGQFVFNLGADSVGLDIGSSLEIEGLRLADPKVRFIIENSYGIPIRIDANELTVLSPDGQQTVFGLGDSMTVGYPAFGEIGETVTTVAEINRSNSDIIPALEAGLASLSWAFSAHTHPDGPDGGSGFILDSSRLAIHMGAEVPLHGQVARCAMSEMIEADLSDFSADPVQSGQLKLIVDNGFPFDLQVQAYFYDGEGLLLDSLFDSDEPLLQPATVDADGWIAQPAHCEHLIDIPADRMAVLPRTRTIGLRASVSTTDRGQVPVRLTEAAHLGIKLGLVADL
ncbi:MAG: hypothetical protein D6722_20930 [Bacteroidetes bacterium]|nr:MAG: hypothetical protein D6722_20930 [Bacteroidota bacterium]